MKKKMLFVIAMVALMLFAPNVSAATIEVKDDATLMSAFTDAVSGDTIKLTEDVTHAGKALKVDQGRVLVLDLNGKTLSIDQSNASYRSVTVSNGSLTVKNGTITHESHTAINVWGSETKNDNFASKLVVEKDVTLNGLYGVAIYEGIEYGAYGVTVDFYGKINAKDLGMTILGNIKQKDGAPVVNVHDGAVINSDAIGIYAAGAGTWNLGNIQVTGKGSALGIKSGKVVINNGTYKATGEKEIPEAYSNGMNDSGSTIQIEANDDYYKNVELVINDGEFISEKSSVILEYIGENAGKVYATDTAVNVLEINGGTFEPTNGESTFIFSTELSKKIPQFISGGVFASDVTSLLKAGYKGYIRIKDDGTVNFVVEKIKVETGINTVSGKITGVNDYNTVTVQLKQGSKVLQISKLDENGKYEFKDVANGTYNVVVVDTFKSQTYFVNVTKDTTLEDISLAGEGSRLVVVGTEDMDVAVDGVNKLAENKEVVVLVGAAEEDKEDKGQAAIKEIVKAKNYEFIDIALLAAGENLNDTGDNVLMFAISYNFKNKTNITLSRYHDGEVHEFTKLDKMPTEYKDQTFFMDEESGILYVFASKFSTYAVGYDTISNPQTGDNVLSYVVMGSVAIVALIGLGFYVKKNLYN